MTVFMDASSNLHPHECDGHGKCIHCDRSTIYISGASAIAHSPATCALCDPGYDGQPNKHWKGDA